MLMGSLTFSFGFWLSHCALEFCLFVAIVELHVMYEKVFNDVLLEAKVNSNVIKAYIIHELYFLNVVDLFISRFKLIRLVKYRSPLSSLPLEHMNFYFLYKFLYIHSYPCTSIEVFNEQSTP